jgi:hypothetical protein
MEKHAIGRGRMTVISRLVDYWCLEARLIGRVEKGTEYARDAMDCRMHDFIHAFGMF